mgnify:CR=1 FL=1
MKQDMSKNCNFGYQTMWMKRDSREISEEEFRQRYNKHCANCLYMNEICMFEDESKMTPQEAIGRIYDHMVVHHIGEYPHIKLAEALEMAIKALMNMGEK